MPLSFLGMTKKDFVAEAARAYLEQRREEIRRGMVESMKLLDGSLASSVSLLTALPVPSGSRNSAALRDCDALHIHADHGRLYGACARDLPTAPSSRARPA